MVFVEQHSRPCSQLYRPQTGHSELRAKPLNAKQLRSDRGNWISVAANRFGSGTEAWCFHRFTTDRIPQRLKEIPSVCLFQLLGQLISEDGVTIVQSLESVYSPISLETKQRLLALRPGLSTAKREKPNKDAVFNAETQMHSLKVVFSVL